MVVNIVKHFTGETSISETQVTKEEMSKKERKRLKVVIRKREKNNTHGTLDI